MIQMMTAYTEEVDEIEDGIAEILEQIDLSALKKNSIGLVTCHFDFTSAGFISELHKKLPFDFIGMTTIASASQQKQSMYALSLTVLTSDDVVFEAAMTGPLGPGDYKQKIEVTYKDTVGKSHGKPSLILTFFPYTSSISGAVMHKSFDEIFGGIPFWGSLATNVDVSYERCHAFHNDNFEKDGLAMILLYGPVEPDFVVVSLPSQSIRKNRGEITKSDGCLLMEINGIPAVKYLENLGVVVMKDATIVTPLMVYYEGSSEPVALGIYAVNDDGSILCGGEMTKGASVAIGEITIDSIISSTAEGMSRVINTKNRNGALFLPCVTRYLMLSPNNGDEMSLIAEKIENGRIMPYMIAYAGGEICPVRDETGVFRNRFHNFTFSACIL